MHLFDLDGTLIDSNGVWEEIDLSFLGRHGLVPTEEYGHEVGHSIFPVAAQYTKDYYGLDMSAEEIMAEWLASARAAYAMQIPMKAGAAAFLAQCHAAGERMALVTACVPELCHAVLLRHGLPHYFEALIFAQEMGLEKRNPLVFLKAAEQLGVRPADCTLYEDAPANCVAAKSAGMQVVGVYDHFYDRYETEMRGTCDRFICSFKDLLV